MTARHRAIGVLMLVLGFAAAMATAAAAGSITVTGAAGASTYRDTLQRMVDEFVVRSESYLDRGDGADTSTALWYNPYDDTDTIVGTVGFNGVDANWARANLRLYDIYRQLGGNKVNLAQYYRRGDGRYYVGLDGAGGKWFTKPTEAQGYMFKLLVSRSAEVPAAVKAALADLGSDDLVAVVAAAREAMVSSRAILVQGAAATVVLTGRGFRDTAGAPVVLAPDGVSVDGVAFDSDTQLTLTVSVTGDAALGARTLHVYNANTSFTPLESYDLLLVSGTGEVTPAADDHGDSSATATAITGASVSAGRIGGAGDRDVFQIVLAAAGSLSVASSGSTDVVLVLEDANGAELARDDDGGAWYNFSLSAALAAGTYYLGIAHCCQGTGSYSLVTSFAAD